MLRGIPGAVSHLVVSKGAVRALPLETDHAVQQVEALAHVVHDPANLPASISSGSLPGAGTMVVPGSMKSQAQTALSLNENLPARAADVTMKERRKLVIVPRETPLPLGHPRHMVAVTDMGAIILPPAPSFHHRPKSIMDIVDQTVGSKVLDQFDLSHALFRRWRGA